jgi:hypothetical protein
MIDQHYNDLYDVFQCDFVFNDRHAGEFRG